MLRCGVGCLLSFAVASCGSAAPSDLLLPHTVAMSDSDSAVSTAAEGGSDAGVADAVPDVTVHPEASAPEDVNQCNAQSCINGCCDMTDQCQQGTDDMACGSGGMACESCASLNETCSAGMCGPMSVPDAGCDPTACPAKCTFGSVPCCTMAGACACTRGFGLCL